MLRLIRHVVRIPRADRVHLRERARHVLAHALLRDVGVALRDRMDDARVIAQDRLAFAFSSARRINASRTGVWLTPKLCRSPPICRGIDLDADHLTASRRASGSVVRFAKLRIRAIAPAAWSRWMAARTSSM